MGLELGSQTARLKPPVVAGSSDLWKWQTSFFVAIASRLDGVTEK
jgi:hypothetical protein